MQPHICELIFQTASTLNSQLSRKQTLLSSDQKVTCSCYDLGVVSKCDSFFKTKLVLFGMWVVFSCHVWKKKQNRTFRFVNKSLKMHLKNGIKLNSVFHTFIWRGWVGGLIQKLTRAYVMCL